MHNMQVKCAKHYEAIQWFGEDLSYVVKDTTWASFGDKYISYYVITGLTKVPISIGWWILLDNGYPHLVISPEVFNKDWEQM
jgi:hypothetical protein